MLAQAAPQYFGIFAALVGVTWILLLFVFLKQRRDLSLINEALRGTSGERLEPLLQEHLRSKQRLEKRADELAKRVAELEQKAMECVSGVGLVRYNAFGDVGGEQSFALALQSEEGDGVVVNSITGREQTRIYCKAVKAGRCDQNLTPEEEKALQLARRRKTPSQAQ